MIDWEKKLEWSDGQPAFLRDCSWQQQSSKEVTSCEAWYDDTADVYVSVDATTGKILGCENEDYPHVRNYIE